MFRAFLITYELRNIGSVNYDLLFDEIKKNVIGYTLTKGKFKNDHPFSVNVSPSDKENKFIVHISNSTE